jgi:hypothetical protein
LTRDPSIFDWRPTPEGERNKALRLTAYGWEPCEVSDLKKGDVFRMTWDGGFVHPLTKEENDTTVSVATADAVKMDPLGSLGQTQGWGVEVEVYESLEQMRGKLT